MRKYVYLETRNQSVIRQVEIDRAAALGTSRNESSACTFSDIVGTWHRHRRLRDLSCAPACHGFQGGNCANP
jgi:hypothetical protein